jgi:WbqC-like protein family
MKVAIMQPYFLPYIGYFQLINAVDVFVVYDNIQFSKKGWFHRNRMLQNGADTYFTLPLKSDSDYLDVNQRFLADSWATNEREKMLRKFKENYRKAPFLAANWPIIEDILSFENNNLFEFNLYSLKKTCDLLGIKTEIKISSAVDIDHSLKGQEKVLAICTALKADSYINPIGGMELYDNQTFESKNIRLAFLKARLPIYPQFTNDFVPALSILDALMFNDIAAIKNTLPQFDILNNNNNE